MPKVKISEYSSTANSNTDVASINIDEGCAPSGINNAIRAVMGHLKDFQTGAVSDPLTVGGVLTVTGGSAAAPAITTSGDTNTGIVFTAADTVAVSTGGTERARFDASGNFGLGVTPSAWSGAKGFQVERASVFGLTSLGGFASNTYLADSGANYRYIATGTAALYLQNAAGDHRWQVAASGTAGNVATFTQAMTLDASGNLGVGTTSPLAKFDVKFATDKHALLLASASYSNGADLIATNDSGSEIALGLGGNTVRFYTGATERASIDSSGNFSIGTTSTAGGVLTVGGGIGPSTDNVSSCGNSSRRWSVIYAGSAIINTSDANSKQDISELDDAEKRVAISIKSLIKKYRFKDAVAKKGDAARIHVGVVAQEIQAAFAAEGLDAHRYAMFCSDTWIDEETNEEITRLGIRYDELWAFVIAAL
jgi:hypothetical protein